MAITAVMNKTLTVHAQKSRHRPVRSFVSCLQSQHGQETAHPKTAPFRRYLLALGAMRTSRARALTGLQSCPELLNDSQIVPTERHILPIVLLTNRKDYSLI